MSNKSNDNGRGFEFACLTVLSQEISKVRTCDVIRNSSYEAAKRAFDSLDDASQTTYFHSAFSMVDSLFDLEPMLIEECDDLLQIKIQSDSQGEAGDVRDIVLLRDGAKWEIGLSLKHNHFAVKHSRLAKTLDFSGKWFGNPCTNTYWDVISSIFIYLENMKKQNKDWKDLPSKEDDVYVPLLKAFVDEINRQNKLNPKTPKKMVEYLLGEFDFYKVISIDNIKTTRIQSFNLHGTLNKSTTNKKATIEIPIVNLPTRIVNLDFKPNSKNTVEMYLDNGWTFSFRIHNASTKVETSLKFDIQIIGMPTTIVTLNCVWR